MTSPLLQPRFHSLKVVNIIFNRVLLYMYYNIIYLLALYVCLQLSLSLPVSVEAKKITMRKILASWQPSLDVNTWKAMNSWVH